MKLLADVKDVFGTIKPPSELGSLVGKGGAEGINFFLSNLVILIFSVSGAVSVIMLLWGAFEWITSEGQKEKVAAAQKKIVNTLVGLVLLSVAFAILRVVGDFTGFELFNQCPSGTVRGTGSNCYPVVNTIQP